MIGQIKQQDYLGTDANILNSADSSLGDQFANNDAKKQLAAGEVPVNKNEQILAGLMFSKNDVLEDVLNNLHYLDDEFVDYLQNKVDSAADLEERVGLKSLLDVITKVLERVKEARAEGMLEEQEEELEISEVRRRMQEVQMGGQLEAENKTFAVNEPFSVQTDKRATFESVLRRFQDLPADMDLGTAVRLNYELCDKEFMDALRAEIVDCEAAGADIEAEEYRKVLDEITKAMAERMSSAQSKLQVR